MSETQLADLVVAWVKQNQQVPMSPCDVQINADTDLLSSGLLDSFGFVDLILYIESLDGCRVDLGDADPSEFTVIKGLCRIALRNLSSAQL
jgi:acyl carrier protein